MAKRGRGCAALLFALGACGARTELAAPISSSACGSSGIVTLATITTHFQLPSAIAVGTADVFWLDPGAAMSSGSVKSVPKCGGPAETLASAQPDLGDLALDDARVYWTNYSAADIGTLMSTSLGGGGLTTLASGGDPAGIAVDATYVYWTDPRAGTVMRVAKAGGAATTLASKQATPTSLAIDGVNAYWTNTGTVVVGPAALVFAPKAGGDVVTLATGAGIYWGIAVDEANVYSTSGPGDGTGTIFSVPIVGGSAVTLASGSPTGLGIDETNLYFTNDLETTGSGAVLRVPKHGGATVTIASDSNHPAGIAIDATRVYWLNIASVMAAPK